MATIVGPAAPDVIHSTRGILDYAVWRGRPYVRKWPRKPLFPRSPAVQATAAAFSSFARRVTSTDPAILASIQTLPGSDTWTARDALTSAIYGHAYK